MKNLKVYLLNPPSTHQLLLPMDSKKVKAGGHKPPLGILYLAAYLNEQVPNCEVVLLDAQAAEFDVAQTLEAILAQRPDVLGVTTWTDLWYPITQLIDAVKARLPETHICLGGPHLGIYPKESLRREAVDSIVIGDGEMPFAHLIRSLQDGTREPCPGLYLAGDIDQIEYYAPYVETDLDLLPHPERRLLDVTAYGSALSNDLMTTMVTSRGCPFQCIFCKLRFQKTMLRSAENIVEEMTRISALGIREIEIYDDTFGVDRNRILKMCELMEERNLHFRITIRDRVSNIDDEVVNALKRVGLARMYLGVESASDETLKKLKKGITAGQARNAVAIAKKAGIEVLTYFMFGLPGESTEHFEKNYRFAIELDPDYVNFSITIPYPGTELYNMARQKGLIDRDIWREFVEQPVPDMQMPVYEETTSREELLRLHQQYLKRFYFRPRFVLNKLMAFGSPRALYKKVKMAISLVLGS